MVSDRMGMGLIERGLEWFLSLHLIREKVAPATVVRQAQECVELLLKGALRLAGVEPSRTHDVGGTLRREAHRFPPWFRSEVERLARVSEWLAVRRGPAFYGDEKQGHPPGDLFSEDDASRAIEHATFVRDVCIRLREDFERARQDAP